MKSVSIVIALVVFLYCFSFNTASASGELYEVQTNIEDGLKVTTIHSANNLNRSANQIYSKEQLANEYGKCVDFNELADSYSIKIQAEKFVKIGNEAVSIPFNVSNTRSSDVWSDHEGYLTIYTTAYDKGYNSRGYKMYLVEGYIDIHKEFKIRQREEVLIRHSSGAIYDTENSPSNEVGIQSYYKKANVPYQSGQFNNNISPSYSSSYGVQYSFSFPGNLNVGGIVHNYIDWSFTGKYRIVVFDPTNVGVSYYHNERWFGQNLSISFGAYGVAVDITGGSTPYDARAISLYP